MANKRLFQILFAREAQPGVQATGLIAAANAVVEIKDPVFSFNVEEYEREILGGNLSPKQALTGKTSATVSFAVELAGSSTASAAPPWAPLLEACGLLQGALYGGLFSGSFTGTATGEDKHFYTGQIIQTASAAKTARVVHDTYEGQTYLYMVPIVGTPAVSDVFFPSSSDVTVGPVCTLTGGAPATAKGFAWTPTSTAISTVTTSGGTGTNSIDHIFTGGTSGAVIQALEAITDGAARKFRILDGIPTAGGETFTNKTGTGTFATSTGTWAMTDFPTISIALIEDGRVKIAKGCRGTVSFSGEPGQPIFMNFSFTGLLSAIQDGGPVSGITRVSKVPPKLQGVDFKIGSFVSGESGYFSHTTAHSPKLLGFTLDMGGAAAVEGDATQSTGVVGAANQTSPRSSQGTLKCGLRPEASFPFAAKQRDGGAIWLKIRLAQSTTFFANNCFMLSTPGAVITGASGGDADGYASDDLSLRLSSRKPSGADGEGGELVLSYLFAQSIANW